MELIEIKRDHSLLHCNALNASEKGVLIRSSVSKISEALDRHKHTASVIYSFLFADSFLGVAETSSALQKSIHRVKQHLEF